MGYRKLTARPRAHAQAAGAIEDLKKFPTRLDAIAREKAINRDKIEISFADEARISQKTRSPAGGQSAAAETSCRRHGSFTSGEAKRFDKGLLIKREGEYRKAASPDMWGRPRATAISAGPTRPSRGRLVPRLLGKRGLFFAQKCPEQFNVGAPDEPEPNRAQ